MDYSDYDTETCSVCGAAAGGGTGVKLNGWADLDTYHPACPACAAAYPQWAIEVTVNERTQDGPTHWKRTTCVSRWENLTYAGAVERWEELTGERPEDLRKGTFRSVTRRDGARTVITDVEVHRTSFGPCGDLTTWNGPVAAPCYPF